MPLNAMRIEANISVLIENLFVLQQNIDHSATCCCFTFLCFFFSVNNNPSSSICNSNFSKYIMIVITVYAIHKFDIYFEFDSVSY